MRDVVYFIPCEHLRNEVLRSQSYQRGFPDISTEWDISARIPKHQRNPGIHRLKITGIPQTRHCSTIHVEHYHKLHRLSHQPAKQRSFRKF